LITFIDFIPIILYNNIVLKTAKDMIVLK